MSSSFLGTLFIAIAATLWATDSLFRQPVVHLVNPTFIVLFEHVIGTIALFAWVFLRQRSKIAGHSLKNWFSLLIIGCGGSAIATVLFTASFQHINPSIAILLQKLQPVIVVLLAFIFLGEKPSKSFWGWALTAIAAALVMSFPDFNFHEIRNGFSNGIDLHSKGVIYALSAAALWGISTVAGKSTAETLPPSIITFWRYAFGLVTLLALILLGVGSIPLEALHHRQTLQPLLYIAAFPGITALSFYYAGLKRTSAITVTFTELLFPVAAVILNWIFLGQNLEAVQIFAGLVLLFSVSKISMAI